MNKKPEIRLFDLDIGIVWAWYKMKCLWDYDMNYEL